MDGLGHWNDTAVHLSCVRPFLRPGLLPLRDVPADLFFTSFSAFHLLERRVRLETDAPGPRSRGKTAERAGSVSRLKLLPDPDSFPM